MVIPEVVETFFSGGSGTSEAPYQISTVEDLEELAARVNGADSYTADAFSGKYFTLTADLDLNNEAWTPIGTSTTPFSGIFDGGDHTISKLSINSSSDNQGLFGYVDGGTIKNLSVTESTITVSGDFNNVGGIVGFITNNATIDNCDFSGTVSGHMGVGGIAGYVYVNAPITNCSFSGTVSGESYIGGIAGIAMYSGSIAYCKNSGTVIGTGDYVGGIVGSGEEPLTIQYCYNTGNVSGDNYSGGIIGQNISGTVSSCYNLGDITTEFSVTGGIAGSNEGLIEYCYNTGYTSNVNDNGGIAGYNSIDGTVRDSYNIGDLEAEDFYGYIVGRNNGTVEKCYYDPQMTYSYGGINGADDKNNQVIGKATADMLGDLFGDTTHWTTDSNLYPRLADPSGSTFDMDTTDVAYVSVTPIRFNDWQRISMVSKDFTVCTDNGVSWSSEDSDLISITGSDATVIKGDTDTYEWGITLTASLNEASRKVYYVNPYSDDAGITSILSEDISAGSEAGTSADPITASISVANSVSAVDGIDIISASDYSRIDFYGTDSTFATVEYGSVALTAGDTTTVYIKVTAQDGVTVGYYAVDITRAATGTSSDSKLTTVLGQTISTEGSGGSVAFPIRTDINVSNSVSDVEATDIVGAVDSAIVFYGTDSTFTTAEAGSVALAAGSSTTVYIKVTAQDGVTVGYYEVEIARAAATSSGSSSGDNTPTEQPTQETVAVIVNGETQEAGQESTTTEDGRTTVTVQLDNKIIEGIIDEGINNNPTGTGNVIQVPVADTDSDVVKVELTGDIVKKLENNTYDVSVKRDNIEYIIPAEEFTISKVAENLGVMEGDLADIKVEVQITKLDQAILDQYNEMTKANGAELVFPPVAFEVVAKTTKVDGSIGQVEISKFSNYVERVMEIPSGVDPSKITTGIVFNPDGTYSHVPTEVFQKDGKWYARLNSLTNSNYSVIWNPITVNSVENHWSKDAANDMASRLVIFDPENFEPNKAITRADFAEYLVRALGLYREGANHENKFTDVKPDSDRTLAILIASEYDLVTGYTDGTFRPDAVITREEAMTMYQRSMKVTKLTGSDVNRILTFTDSAQVSNWARPYVTDVLSAHVFNGTTATTISPKFNLTYAEAAQAIKNLLVESKLINK
jgi:hypothetical protein